MPPIIEHAPGETPGVTTLMAVGDEGFVSHQSPVTFGLIVAGAAAILGSKRPGLWALLGLGYALVR